MTLCVLLVLSKCGVNGHVCMWLLVWYQKRQVHGYLSGFALFLSLIAHQLVIHYITHFLV